MHKQIDFWIVGLVTGFFGGLLTFLLLFVVNLLVNNNYSFVFGTVYLAPAFFMAYACARLRGKYGSGVLSYGSGFRLSLLTGLVTALVMSVAIYFVYTYLYTPTLSYRLGRLESELVGKQATAGYAAIAEKQQTLRNLMSPLNLSLLFAAVNLALSPVYAVIIAIFARRKNRFLE
ncbi:MAG: DUF4199 family protein [Bacteroidetes bacterium]|nr:DUF4199 family protein [Bacteroidota bacterium]